MNESEVHALGFVRNGIFAVGLALLGQPVAAAEMGAVDEPIKLAMLEWTGAQVSAQLAGQILEMAGYKVEFVTAGNFPQFSGLADGTLSASVEVWTNNVDGLSSNFAPNRIAAGSSLARSVGSSSTGARLDRLLSGSRCRWVVVGQRDGGDSGSPRGLRPMGRAGCHRMGMARRRNVVRSHEPDNDSGPAA